MRVITSKRLVDDVYERLRDGILSGELPPGTPLRVAALAEQLGVSRSPIREAVQRLAAERLALEEPRRGAVVASISLDELIRLYEVREVLEGLSARLAATRKTPQLVERLKTALTEQEDASARVDIPAFRAADLHFHNLIRNAAGNPELQRMLDEIESKIRIAMFTRVGATRDQTLAEHWAIFRSIEEGDPAKSAAAAAAHVERLRQTLCAAQAPAPDTSK
jgi:DNA-binding GntR family transcriptional regulator